MKQTRLSQNEINSLLTGTPINPDESECDKRSDKKTKLFRWHVRKIENNGEVYFAAEGNVIDHPYCINSERVVTKPLIRACYEEGSEEVLLYTKETEYHCLISECTFHGEGTCEYIPELKKFEQNKKQLNTPEAPHDMQDGSVLVILSDHYEYYFDSAFVKHQGNCERLAMDVHYGMIVDTCLISGKIEEQKEDHENTKLLHIYYKPHSYHLEFYVWEAGEFNVYFENSGEYTIYLTTPEGIIEASPGKRVLVKRENTVSEEETSLHLDTGKLYWISGGAAD